MTSTTLPPYIEYLLQSESYPHPAESIELLQTHASFIIVAGDYVYKWKKPVDFGFLDFSTLAKRQHYCEEEVRLNRRLCPEIYLGTVTVTKESGGYGLNGDGAIVEYGVQMVRLPEAQMMGRVIARGELRAEHLEKIVDLLVPFYAAADSSRSGRPYGTVEAVGKTVHDNFRETRKFVGCDALPESVFNRISSYTDRFLRKVDLFNERILSDRIRDCHGDLHSGNICLTDEVAIFDCIEFNESLRRTDIAADVAFLAMDLDYHRLNSLSEYFINSFIEASGDLGLLRVLNFYKCYRAYVRGKIGLLTAADPVLGKEGVAKAMSDAAKYFRLADHYGEAG